MGTWNVWGDHLNSDDHFGGLERSSDPEIMLALAVDQAIEIWTNRAKGIRDIRPCPLCKADEILNDGHKCCSSCILVDCWKTPYGRWASYNDWDKRAIKAAGDMLEMLKAYKAGDMETFKGFLRYME